MADRVRITDVSPRDGLQNEPGVIPSAQKIALVRALLACGFDEIEVSSFVSPRWLPQLADADEVFQALADEVRARNEAGSCAMLSALVPNEVGLGRALAVNQRAGYTLIGKVSVFTAASETFSQRNTNASIAQTIERFRPVVNNAHERGLLVRGYVSCAVACPFEGAIDPAAVLRVAQQLADIGIDEIDLGDTIGVGTPDTIAAMLARVQEGIGQSWMPRLTLHLHDTNGMAGLCVQRALEMGIRSFDASVAGLGGCPYASTPERRAPGNLAMETLIATLQQRNGRTDIDTVALDKAVRLAREIVAAARVPAGETAAGGGAA
jgi:hydroxymethylglutaryl-CoA lyase